LLVNQAASVAVIDTMIPIGTVVSSLPLQKLLYFNVQYSIVYWVAQVALVVYKLAFLDVKDVTRYGTPAIVFAWTVAEIVRLRLGYVGNLREKVRPWDRSLRTGSDCVVTAAQRLLVACAGTRDGRLLAVDAVPAAAVRRLPAPGAAVRG